MEFAKEGAGEHGEAHGTTKLYVDDEVVAEGPMRTQLAQFTLCGDGLCVGRDSADAVSKEYTLARARSRAARSSRSRSTSATTRTSTSRSRPPR